HSPGQRVAAAGGDWGTCWAWILGVLFEVAINGIRRGSLRRRSRLLALVRAGNDAAGRRGSPHRHPPVERKTGLSLGTRSADAARAGDAAGLSQQRHADRPGGGRLHGLAVCSAGRTLRHSRTIGAPGPSAGAGSRPGFAVHPPVRGEAMSVETIPTAASSPAAISPDALKTVQLSVIVP